MRLFNKILVFIFFVALFSNCQQRNLKADWYKEVIEVYFSETIENFHHYIPLDFQIINENFLSEQLPVRNIVEELKNLYPKFFSVSEKFMNIGSCNENQLIIKGIDELPVLAIDTIPQYIQVTSKIDHLLLHKGKESNNGEIIPTDLKKIRNSIEQEVMMLNDILNIYNLSVYSTNVLGKDTIIVYHKYKTMNVTGSLIDRESVFEISRDSHRVIAEKVLK